MSTSAKPSTPPARRGRPRRATATAAIVDATLDLLGEVGFRGATMDAIAARAGVGKNTIYRRWSAKEELIADALAELSTAPGPTGHDGLYELLRAYLRDQERELADPRVGRLLPGLLGELADNPEFAAAWVDRVVRPRRQKIVELLAAAVERGELGERVDPDVVADLLLGPPLLRLLFPLGLPDVPATYEDELLATIWRGIAPRG